MKENSVAFVVDDKTKQREWGTQVLKSIGYDMSQIVPCFYGDDALRKYKEYIGKDYTVDIVLTDYHMDVKRKPPQDYCGSIKNAKILDGIALIKQLHALNAKQLGVVVSRGLDQTIADIAAKDNIPVFYKRQPEEKKFADYVAAIKQILTTGRVDEDLKNNLANVGKFRSS